MGFKDIAEKRKWPPEDQVSILLENIENQQSPEAFEDFLESKISKDTFFELFVTERIGMSIVNQSMVGDFPFHYIDCEQPATCPRCGARTNFEELEDTCEGQPLQMHICLNRECCYLFVGSFDPEQVKELKTQNDEEEKSPEDPA